MKIPKPKKTVLDEAGPLTAEDRRTLVDELLKSEKKRVAVALAIVLKECQSKPAFLEKLLKEIKPLRGRGPMKPDPTRAILVAIIARELKGYKVDEIFESIAAQCHVSKEHARTLYYLYLAKADL